mmetsp:Transcript_13189/g.34554  ORF Transcript_13189/g.34554 Transcript_13189/m.34554 type:complete len:278 (+) Transcript_13189:2395-3228(+)
MAIMVMSSVRTSYWSHSLYASFTTARQAFSGDLNCVIMLTTVWLVRNSQTPSDAIRTIRSSLHSWRVSTSGSAKTPTRSPNSSPTERVKAQPGIISPSHQIRGGSPPASGSSSMSPPSSQSSCISSSPSSWSIVATTAPATLHRSRSSLLKGVWSWDSASAWSLPSPLSCARQARESPRLATWTVPPRKKTAMQVVPLSESSTCGSSCRLLFTSTSEFVYACFTSISDGAIPLSSCLKHSFLIRSGQLSRIKWAQRSPVWPCPSKTAKTWQSSTGVL